MVCATARSAPIRAYFEFEAQPDPRIVYTVRLERARIKRMLRFKSVSGNGNGMGAHKMRARVRAKVGANRKSRGEEVDG